MDQARLLITLQETDLALVRARKRLADMPERTAVLETRKRIRELEALHNKTQAAWEAIDRRVRLHEDEADVLHAKIEAEQARLMAGGVTNPKEVQNISREMDSLRRHKDKLENGTLDEMEKREQMAGQRKKVEAAVDVSKRKEATALVTFQKTGAEIQREIDRLAATRITIARKMEAGLLARYESLRDSKHGIGVGELRDDTCSACRVGLPAERVQALVDGDSPIAVCPTCHRLLIVMSSAGTEGS
jgi:predicted  nucleic acid-binding Zn-ribbon protein